MYLVIAFFLTAVISVVTGGTSLITVPVMMQFGLDPHVSVATNMLALIFLSLGGTLPFLKSNSLPRRRLPALIALTLCGSVLGAFLLVIVPSKAMPLIIAVAMIVLVVFLLFKSDAGAIEVCDSDSPPRTRETAAYCATLLLGIYGGFFSGGYVALLTAAYVAFFRMSFLEAIAITKVLNFFSSSIATAIFSWRGLIDWKLGFFLCAASFAGAMLGAVLARKTSDLWLRRVFLTTALGLALKVMLFDVMWKNHSFSLLIEPAARSRS
jgi:uncharacterized membrane protein YfcA